MNSIFNESIWLNNFDDIIKKEKAELLKNILNIGNFKLLIYGPFDSGKTSLINLIFSFLNKDEFSIFKIDTVDDNSTLNLRNKINIFIKRETHKKKLIVIDDIHLITEKIQFLIQSHLENIKNLNIIITSNDINKIVRGIQSRFLNLELETPTYEKLKNVMNKIIKYYDLNISKTASDLIIHISNLSFKKMINNLLKIYFLKQKISLPTALKIFNNLNHHDIKEYIQLCVLKKTKKAITKIKSILNNGYNLFDFLEEVSQYLIFQKTILQKENIINSETYPKVVKIIMKYIDIINNNSMNDNIIISYFFTIDLLKIYF